MFDVVEHVPPADRASLFEQIGRVLAPGGWVLFSTPHPDFLRWVHEHRPELLQVVDEPVELGELIELGARIGRELVAYRSYQLDAPGARQYQLVVLAPPAAQAQNLYRPATLHRLRARLGPAREPPDSTPRPRRACGPACPRAPCRRRGMGAEAAPDAAALS